MLVDPKGKPLSVKPICKPGSVQESLDALSRVCADRANSDATPAMAAKHMAFLSHYFGGMCALFTDPQTGEENTPAHVTTAGIAAGLSAITNGLADLCHTRDFPRVTPHPEILAKRDAFAWCVAKGPQGQGPLALEEALVIWNSVAAGGVLCGLPIAASYVQDARLIAAQMLEIRRIAEAPTLMLAGT